MLVTNAEGHLGDLPGLHVGADGKAVTPVLAPRLKLSDLAGRSLMIHGGARLACGVVK